MHPKSSYFLLQSLLSRKISIKETLFLQLFVIMCVLNSVVVLDVEEEDNFVSLAEDIGCGNVHQFYRSEREGRILGGETADLGEFPFLASIQKEGIHFCSAFIVKKQVMVTAAHCFLETLHGSTSYKNYEILVGSNDWADKRNLTNMFRISDILIHPEYSYLKPNVENDIAILRIDRPVSWTNRIQPICLAARELGYHEYGWIAGWGARSQSQRENMKEWMQDTSLYKVALPLWTNHECQAEYRKHRINWNTKSSHVCAGFQQKEKDTCQGDSGSPLILHETSGKRIAYGIVSVGEGCAKLPGIYTRISSFIPWIKQNS